MVGLSRGPCSDFQWRLLLPWGQVTVWASQSIWKSLNWKAPFSWDCQLMSGCDFTDQCHPIFCLRSVPQISRPIGRINDMLTWEQFSLGESLMNTGKGTAISLGRWSRFHMGNQMRRHLVTGFGQMNFVPNPGHTAL